MDLDTEGVVGTQDRVVLGRENPGRVLGVEGKEGVDEGSGASVNPGEFEELSKRFIELKESAHPGFAMACRAMGLTTPELEGTWSQI